MAKLLLSALLRRRQEGIEAESAEFPDIKVSGHRQHLERCQRIESPIILTQVEVGHDCLG